jgi:hypothetical protein
MKMLFCGELVTEMRDSIAQNNDHPDYGSNE